MLDWIFEGIVGWVASIISQMLDAVSGLFLEALGTDMTAMEEYFPFVAKAYDVMQVTAYAILILIVIWQLFRTFGGPITEAENPWHLTVRGALFAFLIYYAKPIFSVCLSIARAPYTSLMDLSMTGEDFTFAGVEQVLTNGLATIISAASVVGLILIIILLISLGWNYFKLLLETVERYVVVGVLCYTSPLAFSLGGSKATNNVFRSWCRMVGSQLLLLVMNVWFLRGFASSVGQFIGNGGALSTGQGSIFLWMFCALAYLKCAQRFDSYLASMGLNVAQTGSSMGMELLMAARVISGVGSGAKSAGSVFGRADGSATATGTGAAATGFAAGFASRFNPNSYVRDAVVDGGTRMGFSGGAGFVGRVFGGMAARNGATLNGQSISSVASRAPGGSGTIAGDIADRSLSNYLPHMKGFQLKGTQITGGHISTTATTPDGKKANVDLYSAAQYEKPDVPHSVVTAADGSQWYQVASGEGRGAFYDAPVFGGMSAQPAEGSVHAESGAGADVPGVQPDASEVPVAEGLVPRGEEVPVTESGSLTDQPPAAELGRPSIGDSAVPADAAEFDSGDIPHPVAQLNADAQTGEGVDIPNTEAGVVTELQTGFPGGTIVEGGEMPPSTASGQGVPASDGAHMEAHEFDAATVAGTGTDGNVIPFTDVNSETATPVQMLHPPEGTDDIHGTGAGFAPELVVPQPALDQDAGGGGIVGTPIQTGPTPLHSNGGDQFPESGATVTDAPGSDGHIIAFSGGSGQIPAPASDADIPESHNSGVEVPQFGAIPIPGSGEGAGEVPHQVPALVGGDAGGGAVQPESGVITDPSETPVSHDAGFDTPQFAGGASGGFHGADHSYRSDDDLIHRDDSFGYSGGSSYGGYAEAPLVAATFPSAQEGTMLRTVGDGVIEASSPDGGNTLWYNSAFYQEPDAPHSVMEAANGVQWYAMQQRAQAPQFESGSDAAQYNQALFRDFMPGYEGQVARVDGSHSQDGHFEVRNADGSGTVFYDTARFAVPRGDYQILEDARGSQWYAIRGEAAVERKPVYENGQAVYDDGKLRTVSVETVRYRQTPARFAKPKKSADIERKPPRKRQ